MQMNPNRKHRVYRSAQIATRILVVASFTILFRGESRRILAFQRIASTGISSSSVPAVQRRGGWRAWNNRDRADREQRSGLRIVRSCGQAPNPPTILDSRIKALKIDKSRFRFG
jgi:hypothetical protein